MSDQSAHTTRTADETKRYRMSWPLKALALVVFLGVVFLFHPAVQAAREGTLTEEGWPEDSPYAHCEVSPGLLPFVTCTDDRDEYTPAPQDDAEEPPAPRYRRGRVGPVETD